MKISKWRVFRLGKHKLALNERRTRLTGLGYKLGVGHNIEEVCHAYYKNGLEVWKKTKTYKVEWE